MFGSAASSNVAKKDDDREGGGGADGGDDEPKDEPPKVEVNTVKEDDAVHSVRWTIYTHVILFLVTTFLHGSLLSCL